MSFNLNQISSLSVQELVRDGHKHDLYYYDSANMFVQERPTLVNNKFLQQFVSLGAGTNQLIFSPDQGLSDVIVVIALKQEGVDGATYGAFGLNRGWGYAMVDQIAVRYGGSSQYFWTGNQMLMENVVEMNDAVSRDTLYDLGGQACLGANPLTGGNDFSAIQTAYVYINLPHNSPNGDGAKPMPCPTELLRQPVLVQVTLKDPRTVFSGQSASPSVAGAFPQFQPISEAYFQVKQVRMINSADLLTAHHDPASISYTLPLKAFYQQENTVAVTSANPAQVNLTGFRNGSVRSIILWLTADNNTPNSASAGASLLVNPNLWVAPQGITLSINGEIFYRSKYKSSLLLDLVSNRQPNRLACTAIASVAPVAPATNTTLEFVPGGYSSEYVKVDFSQVNDAVFGTSMLVAGKSITNSIVNLQFSPPADASPSNPYTLHALYVYSSSLIFAGGNAEYVF